MADVITQCPDCGGRVRRLPSSEMSVAGNSGVSYLCADNCGWQTDQAARVERERPPHERSVSDT